MNTSQTHRSEKSGYCATQPDRLAHVATFMQDNSFISLFFKNCLGFFDLRWQLIWTGLYIHRYPPFVREDTASESKLTEQY
jgi:hypothetical protein